MNRSEMFNEVKSWLEAEKLAFVADDEEASFQVRMNIETGLVQVGLRCEDSPALLQVMCVLPVKAPKEKIAVASVLLHNLNLRLRIGGFHLILEERLITFRLPLPIRPESDLRKQFGEAFGTALGTLNYNLQPLALFLCSTDEAREAVAKVTPGEAFADVSPRPSCGRLELN